jgi:hypothetical protein
MSSKFRKESYTIGDLTLVALVGDEREALALVDDDDDSVSFTSNSWPRPEKSEKIKKTNVEIGLYNTNNNLDDIITGLERRYSRSRERTRRMGNNYE